METKTELKVVYIAIALIACQVLGVDTSILAQFSTNPDLLAAIQAANKDGGSSLGAAALAGVYTLCRSYIKGRKP